MAGLAAGPPFLHARVGRYQCHVGIEVVSDILEVGKQKAVLVVDPVVANPGSRANRRRAAVCIPRIFPGGAGSWSRSVSWWEVYSSGDAARKPLVNFCLARAPARCALRAISDVLPPLRPGFGWHDPRLNRSAITPLRSHQAERRYLIGILTPLRG